MGDMAEFYLDSLELSFWGQPYNLPQFERIPPKCNYCGEKNLSWAYDTKEQKYRLSDINGWHICFSKLKEVRLEDIIEIFIT